MKFKLGMRCTAVVLEALENRQLCANVALFFNASNVDTDADDGTPASAINLKEELEGLGHNVKTFTSTSVTALEAALGDADVLVVPDLSKSPLVLTNTQQNVIRDFVAGGGGYVTAGGADSAQAMIGFFGYSTFEVGLTGRFDTDAELTNAAEGTAFAGGDEQVTWQSAVYSIHTGNAGSNGVIDNDGKSVYQGHVDSGSVSTVTVFPYAERFSVVYLGNTWAEAGPNGTWDGNWKDALNRGIAQAGGASLTAPEIEVQGTGVTINNGDSLPSASNTTEFGATVVGSSISQSFSVTNSGDGPLTTSQLTAPAGFTITQGLGATIPVGGQDTFTVRLDATAAGTFSGNVSFASNDADESPFTFAIRGVVNAVAEPQPPTSNLPAAPSGVLVKEVTTSQFVVQWTDNADDELGYVLEVATAPGGPWLAVASTLANGTSATVGGRMPGTDYFARVRATGSSGMNSHYSETVATHTEPLVIDVPQVAPAAPSNVTLNGIAAGQITVNWADNASGETGYQVEFATSPSGPFSGAGSTGPDGASYTVTGLTAGTPYSFRVRAIGTAGLMSDYSPIVSAQTTGTPPSGPAQTSGFTVSFTIPPANASVLTGSGDAVAISVASSQAGSTYVTLYASSQPTLNASAVALTTTPIEVKLNATRPSTVKVKFTYPGQAGQVYLIARASTSADVSPSVSSAPGGIVDGTATVATPINVSAASVALQPSGLTLAKASLTAGKSNSITLMIKNSGNVAYKGTTNIALSLTNESGNVVLPSSAKKFNIKVGKTKRIRLKIAVPTNLAANSYGLSAVITGTPLPGVDLTGDSVNSPVQYPVA